MMFDPVRLRSGVMGSVDPHSSLFVSRTGMKGFGMILRVLCLALAIATNSASVVHAENLASVPRASPGGDAKLMANGHRAHLDAPSRQDLLRTLRQLTEARGRLAGMISDCSGGRILVFGCARRPGSKCREAVAPCSVVEAFQAITLAILRIDTALRD